MGKKGYVVILTNRKKELKIVGTQMKPSLKTQEVSKEEGERFTVVSWSYVTDFEYVASLLREELFEGQITSKADRFKASPKLTKKMLGELAAPYLTTVDGQSGMSRWLNILIIAAFCLCACFALLADGGDREQDDAELEDDAQAVIAATTETELTATQEPKATTTQEPKTTRTPRATITRAPTRTAGATRTSVVRSEAEREEDRYRVFMIENLRDLGWWLSDFATVNQQLSSDPTLIVDKLWKLEVISYMTLIRGSAQEVIDYEAPKSFQKFDDEAKEVMSLYYQSMGRYENGLNGNVSELETGVNLFLQATDKLNELDLSVLESSPSQARRGQNGNATGVVTASSLNVRGGPGVNNVIVGSLGQGNKVKILGYSDNWANIELADGTEGWVSASYLEISDDKIQTASTEQAPNPTQTLSPTQRPEPTWTPEPVQHPAWPSGDGVYNLRCGEEGNVQLCAWVNNSNPRSGAAVTVFGRLYVDGYAQYNYPMKTTWHYKSKDSYCNAGVTDDWGVASCWRDTGRPTKGYQVNITVEINGWRINTGFIPR